MLWKSWSFLGTIAFLSACGSVDDTAAHGTPNDNGGTGGGSPSGGTSGQSVDFDVLSTCGGDATLCRTAGVQLVEDSALWFGADVACVLRALKSRTPGRYTYHVNSTWTNGTADADHVLVVADDGSVTYARKYRSSAYFSADEPTVEEGAEPARRCSLKPASYMDTCLATLDRMPPTDREMRNCIYGEGTAYRPGDLLWFENCISATPAVCK